MDVTRSSSALRMQLFTMARSIWRTENTVSEQMDRFYVLKRDDREKVMHLLRMTLRFTP